MVSAQYVLQAPRVDGNYWRGEGIFLVPLTAEPPVPW